MNSHVPKLIAKLVALTAAAGLIALALAPLPARAALIPGGNYGGADITPANGDILSGVFTNVGTLSIGVGSTVFVSPIAALSVTAGSIDIQGTLNGTGAGFAGGASVANQRSGCIGTGTVTGNAGAGPGGGAGGRYGCNVHGSGGGGGGYGGAGGDSASMVPSEPSPAAPGGAAFGDESSPIVNQGSGGGSGSRYGTPSGSSGAGGAGGAAISLFGSINLDGSILVDGVDGQSHLFNVGNAAGGGGSGGGILLSGDLSLNGLLSATGGDGGNGDSSAAGWGSGGGGGGGGRIKLFGIALFEAGFSFDVSGGFGGSSTSDASRIVSTATAGLPGTFHNGTVPEPATIMLLGIALAGLGLGRRLAPY